jgi:hypothetical protein
VWNRKSRKYFNENNYEHFKGAGKNPGGQRKETLFSLFCGFIFLETKTWGKCRVTDESNREILCVCVCSETGMMEN